MALTFSKKTSGSNLPPAGKITFTVANGGPWVIDDSTNTAYVATQAEAALLRSHVGIWLKET